MMTHGYVLIQLVPVLAAVVSEYLYAIVVDTSPTIPGVTAPMLAHVSVSATIVTLLLKHLSQSLPTPSLLFMSAVAAYPTRNLVQLEVP